MSTALIVVDVQNDFCSGGSLAVEGSTGLATAISSFLARGREEYDVVVATMDWHPKPGHLAGFEHFSDDPDYVDTWPPHCVQGTKGARLHPDLSLREGAVVVRKGQTAAAFSGFEGYDERGVSLGDVLRRSAIDQVDVVGLAADYCVKATALDAKELGFAVRVLMKLTAGVAPDSTEQAVREMRAAGVDIVE